MRACPPYKMQTTTLSTLDNSPDAGKERIQSQIFIGGCSRSGTTLLGAMIGGHPEIICTPESQFKSQLLRQIVPHVNQLDKTAVLQQLSKHWRFKIWGIEHSNETLAQMMTTHSYRSLLNTVVTAYAQGQSKPNASVWVDHTPENIGYTQSLLNLFPSAKFLHIVRDGRAVAASIMPLDWGPNTIIKAARWWMRMTSFGLAAQSFLPQGTLMQIKYEDLLLNPEKTMRSICQFINVEFHPNMLNAAGFTPPAYTLRQHQLVGRKPDAAMATMWRRRLTARQIEIFEHQTRDFLPNLGYQLEYGIQAKGPNFGEIWGSKGKELIRGEFLNKIKWLIRSYPVWVSPDFYSFANFSDSNN